MASKQTTPLSSPLRFPHWQNEYEAALRETDHKMLFKRVEIAEATLLNRREALGRESHGRAEEKEIAGALERLLALKRDVLNFSL
jgi:hypothetical protein